MTPESGAEVETTLARAEPKPDMTVSDDSLPGSLVPRVIKNRFVLENRLGDGGMGVVYKAIDRNRQDADDPVVHVAIKLIGESIQAHPQAALALQREGRRT